MEEEHTKSRAFFSQDDDMSDTGLNTELVEAVPWNIETLLGGIYQFEVSIKDHHFECHSFPFALKSSYFKASIAAFKTSLLENARSHHPILRINLSELPGGSQTFELIKGFCYESRIKITKQNVLNLLSASKFLGFNEDVAPENLYGRCYRFVEMESANGIQSILTMLAHSSTNDSYVTDYGVLFNELSEHALEFQDLGLDRKDEIVELLLGLTKLKPGFLNAALQDFKRLGVNMVDFLWCKGTSTNLDSILGGDEDCHTNRLSIVKYFVESLDECISAGEIHIDLIDPKKLILVWTLTKDPLFSQDAIKAYISSELYRLKAEDIMGLSPELIQDLLCSAVSASRSSFSMEEEIQHLGDLVDEVLLFTAKRCPWDGSLDSKLNFQQMAMCIPLNGRESHDKLYDAVACFSRSFTQAQSSEIWNMIDTGKLSPSKVEIAVNFTLSQESSYLARLMRRREDDLNSLKRKFTTFEEHESQKRTVKITEYSGSRFTIFVTSLDAKTLCVLVESHTTIFSIKQGIEKMGSMQFERPWCLIYQGKRLLSEFQTIASYGILKDCTLCMKILIDREADAPIVVGESSVKTEP